MSEDALDFVMGIVFVLFCVGAAAGLITSCDVPPTRQAYDDLREGERTLGEPVIRDSLEETVSGTVVTGISGRRVYCPDNATKPCVVYPPKPVTVVTVPAEAP